MNSRERVLATFARERPDRVPRWCGATPEFWRKAQRQLGLSPSRLIARLGDDFRRVQAPVAGPVIEVDPWVESVTPFGVERAGYGYGQAISHPLADATLREVHDYAWPCPAWTDVTTIRQQALQWNGEYAILGGPYAVFWHDLTDLLGMEGALMKMCDEPELVDAVLTHVVDYYVGVCQRIFEAADGAIDIFFMANDFGTQRGPIVSPAMFRRFLMPPLARLADVGHAYGLKVMLHCCGDYAALMPSVIDAGVDAVQALQPCSPRMDAAKLKEAYGDKLVLNGAIDSHHVLIEGTVEEVRAETRRILDIMMPGGGYIASASHDTILGQTPVENVLAMFDTVEEHGRYARLGAARPTPVVPLATEESLPAVFT